MTRAALAATLALAAAIVATRAAPARAECDGEPRVPGVPFRELGPLVPAADELLRGQAKPKRAPAAATAATPKARPRQEGPPWTLPETLGEVFDDPAAFEEFKRLMEVARDPHHANLGPFGLGWNIWDRNRYSCVDFRVAFSRAARAALSGNSFPLLRQRATLVELDITHYKWNPVPLIRGWKAKERHTMNALIYRRPDGSQVFLPIDNQLNLKDLTLNKFTPADAFTADLLLEITRNHGSLRVGTGANDPDKDEAGSNQTGPFDLTHVTTRSTWKAP